MLEFNKTKNVPIVMILLKIEKRHKQIPTNILTLQKRRASGGQHSNDHPQNEGKKGKEKYCHLAKLAWFVQTFKKMKWGLFHGSENAMTPFLHEKKDRPF